MKKQNFKKILSILLVTVMLSSMVIMSIPASADSTTPLISETLAGNTVNDIAGVDVRMDYPSGHPDSYVKLNSDGTIEVKGSRGDLFWLPNIEVSSNSVITSSVTMDACPNTTASGAGVAFGINPTNGWDSEGDLAVFLGTRSPSGGSRVFLATAEYATSTKSADFKDVLNKYVFTNQNTNFGETWTPGHTVNTVISQSGNTVSVSFKDENGDYITDIESVSYTNENYPISGAVGFMIHYTGGSDYHTFTINEFKITNAKVDGQDVAEFDLSDYVKNYMEEKLETPLMMLDSGIEFDGGYVFADYEFIVNEDYVSTAQVVISKNDTEISRKSVSELVAVEGKYSYTAYFEYGDGYQETDVLTFKLENNGAALGEATTIELGAKYHTYVNKPFTVTSSDELKYAIYVEDFSEDIVLVPGVNIVNGHKWTYIKNSTFGSAEIKNGRLYFVGGDNDMLLFDDIMLDKTSYKFTYDITYLETPQDDVWDNFDSWVGGMFHLANEADGDGNRNAIIAAVNPDDIYMMQGKVNANGVFTADEDLSSETSFLTSGKYWNGRLGNGAPATIYNYFAIDGGDNGGLYVSGYNGSSHQAAVTLPGDGPLANDVRVGRVGFVSSTSRVSVVIDNIEIMTLGKKISVDGEEMQISGNGMVDIESLQGDETKLIYANVDGTPKYIGDIITANRLTQITTTQIALNTGKIAAVGQTGLKWTTQISKADYEKLTSDANIEKVEVGTVVVPTANAKNGVAVENATKNIAGTATLSGDNYVFEGVLDIDKDARDTSYSAVGYVKVTMKDGKVVYAYADYIARLHAFALSDLVEEFIDDEPVEGGDETASGDTNTDATDAMEGSTDTAGEEKKGCGSSIAGLGVVICATVAAACVPMIKKKENND